MKDFAFYALIILFVGTILSFVLGFWKIGMIIGTLLSVVALSVGVGLSLKNRNYGHEPKYTNRTKKYRD